MSSNKFNARAARVRYKLRKLALGKPRLSVFRSNRNIYVQMIDDRGGITLHSSSSLKIENKILDILACIRTSGVKNTATEKLSENKELIEILAKRAQKLQLSDPIGEAISIIQEIIGYNNDSKELIYPELKQVFSFDEIIEVIANPKSSDKESIANLIIDLCLAMYNCNKSQMAILVGINFCKTCKEDITREVVFDKGGYSYHGIIAKLADTIRSGGFKF